MIFGSKQVVGLDLGTSSIKMVELKATGRSYKMTNFGMSAIPEALIDGGEIIDPSALSQIIMALHKELGIKTKSVCTGMFGGAVIVKKDINIGIATALPTGTLIVPVVKNADQRNLLGLVKSVNSLVQKARNNKLSLRHRWA